MNTYKLLTPGPLTTTETVKSEMMVDHCTWDDDYKETRKTIYGDDSGETPVPMSEKEVFNNVQNQKTFGDRTDT